MVIVELVSYNMKSGKRFMQHSIKFFSTSDRTAHEDAQRKKEIIYEPFNEFLKLN